MVTSATFTSRASPLRACTGRGDVTQHCFNQNELVVHLVTTARFSGRCQPASRRNTRACGLRGWCRRRAQIGGRRAVIYTGLRGIGRLAASVTGPTHGQQTEYLYIAIMGAVVCFCRIPRVRWSSSSRRGSPTPARRVGRTSALICSRRSWPLPRRAARPRPRRRRGHPGRRRDRHGGPAAPGLPRRRAGPAPAVRAAAHAATAHSLAACAAIPAWVTLRPGGRPAARATARRPHHWP